MELPAGKEKAKIIKKLEAAKKEEKKAKAKVDQKKAKVKQTKDAKNVAKAQVAKKTEEKGKAEGECDDAEKAEGKNAKKIVQMAESGIAFWEAKLRTVPALLKTKTDVQSMLPILRDEHKWKKKIEELKKAEKEGTKKALKGKNL